MTFLVFFNFPSKLDFHLTFITEQASDRFFNEQYSNNWSTQSL